jgi:hypothetical protein
MPLNRHLSNRIAISLGCGLLLLAGTACSSSGGKSSPQQLPTTTVRKRPVTRATKPARSTTTKPGTPTTTPVTLAPQPKLADLILSSGPAGYVLQPDDIGDTGPTNLIKATNDDNSADARAALLSAGFDAGYQRLWTSVDDKGVNLNQDYLFLYRFKTPEGAQAFMQHWRLGLLDTVGGKAAATSFTPPLIPDAVGVSAISQEQGSTGVVLFTKGIYAVQALVVGAPAVDQSGVASDIAYAQYEQLP